MPHRKEWLIQGLLIAAEIVCYWRGVFDTNHLIRFAVSLVAYNVLRYAVVFVKMSDKTREILMAIVVAGLVIWLTGRSRNTIIFIIAWTAFFLFRSNTR